MKKILALSLCASLLLTGLLFAAEQLDQQQHPACAYCGMNRVKFAHSRMLIDYQDGSSAATCSLHCAAVELALSIDKTPQRIQVGDLNTTQLIDVEQAAWVIGGGKPGVMTSRAKWAFADKSAAEDFVRNNGGVVANFELAMKAAYEDMYKDTRMIRQKRKMKKMQRQPNVQ